jgi:hypothetical protein
VLLPPAPAFSAVVARTYLVILQDIAPIPDLILSSYWSQNGAQLYKSEPAEICLNFDRVRHGNLLGARLADNHNPCHFILPRSPLILHPPHTGDDPHTLFPSCDQIDTASS